MVYNPQLDYFEFHCKTIELIIQAWIELPSSVKSILVFFLIIILLNYILKKKAISNDRIKF